MQNRNTSSSILVRNSFLIGQVRSLGLSNYKYLLIFTNTIHKKLGKIINQETKEALFAASLDPILGLDQTGHMSFQTGHPNLPDWTKSGLIFLNILDMYQERVFNSLKKWFFFSIFNSVKNPASGKENVSFPDSLDFVNFPDFRTGRDVQQSPTPYKSHYSYFT